MRAGAVQQQQDRSGGVEGHAQLIAEPGANGFAPYASWQSESSPARFCVVAARSAAHLKRCVVWTPGQDQAHPPRRLTAPDQRGTADVTPERKRRDNSEKTEAVKPATREVGRRFLQARKR